MSIKINPLALPKSRKQVCELCGDTAFLACAHCGVTFYCGGEHQHLDWDSIHGSICQLLKALRSLRPTLGSEDERHRRELAVQMSEHALIDLCKSEAQKHLVQGRPELAIPAAMQSLRFSIAVHGQGHAALTDVYLILAESNMQLERLENAETFLMKANWAVMNHAASSSTIKSRLHRAFGRLHVQQRRFDEALKQFALDAYHASLDFGPESIQAATAYFELGEVLMLKQKPEKALALERKVVAIWRQFLSQLRTKEEVLDDYVSAAEAAEAAQMLHRVHDDWTELLAEDAVVGEVALTRGHLEQQRGDAAAARDLYNSALRIFELQLGVSHESTQSARDALRQIEGASKPQQDLAAGGDAARE